MTRERGKKVVKTVSTVFLLLVFFYCPVFAAEWMSGGPYGGSVESLAMASTNPDIIYAGKTTGSFKTVNGGEIWTPTGLEFSTLEVRVDPSDPDILYACTLSGIYKSEDAGNTWELIFTEDAITITIDPLNPLTLYAGEVSTSYSDGTGVLYKSTNGGENWQSKIQASAFWEGVLAIQIDPQSTSHIYAGLQSASTSGVNFAQSEDGGENWGFKTIGSDFLNDVVALAVSPSAIYAIVEGDDVYKSTDGGNNWKDTNVPYISEDGPWALATDPNNPDVIYVGTYKNDGSIYKSINGGTSWSLKASGLPDGAGPSSIVVDPRNSDVYVGLYGGVYKSTNGGESWQTSGLRETTSIIDLAVDSTSSGVAIGIMGPYGDRLAATSDEGASWKILVNSPDNVGAVAIDSQNSDTFWTGDRFNSCSYVDGGCYLENLLYKTTNGGESWSQIPLQMHFCDAPSSQCYTGVNDLLIKADDSDSLLVSESQYQGYVYRTDDGGLNWRASGGYASALTADPNDPNVVYKGEPFVNSVYRSSDFGSSVTSWVNISPTEDSIEGVWDIEVDNASRVYVVAGGELWRWDGDNWVKFAGLPNITALAIDRSTSPGKVYFGTDGDGVYVSADGGNLWTYFGEGLEELYIRKLDVSETSPKILYASTNAGVWSMSLSEDNDIDGDGLSDSIDNCPATTNPDQDDADSDGVGDVCDPDDDNDGVSDDSDNCPDIANPDQSDVNGNGVGDACDTTSDTDNDGQTDARELSCGADPTDPLSRCSAGLPWLILLLEDE